jgi:glycosyltransferase involved in cell wall biosynthesis
MNILLLSQNIALGGAQRVVIHLSDYLNRNGHKAWILTPHLDLEELPPIAKRQQYIQCPYPILKKVNYEYKMKDNIFALALNIFRIRRHVQQVVKQYDIDLINAHNPPCNWLAAFSKVPVVWSCNEPVSLCFSNRRPDYFPLSVETPTLLSHVLERIYEAVDYGICHWGIDQFVVLSAQTQKGVHNIYERQAIINPVGVEFDRFTKGNGNLVRERHHCRDAFLLLHVGHFKPEKNQQLSVRALSLLKERNPHLRLLFVGAGALEDDTRRLAKQLGIADRVIFAGRVREEELPDYYAACDLLIFPAVRQSWGLVAFEALAAGKPSLVSADCGVGGVLREQEIGFVCEPTPEAFAENILNIYSERQSLDGTVARGREYIQCELTYEAYGKRMADLFENLLKTRAARN